MDTWRQCVSISSAFSAESSAKQSLSDGWWGVKAFSIIFSGNILNSTGDNGHLCRTSTVVRKKSPTYPFSKAVSKAKCVAISALFEIYLRPMQRGMGLSQSDWRDFKIDQAAFHFASPIGGFLVNGSKASSRVWRRPFICVERSASSFCRPSYHPSWSSCCRGSGSGSTNDLNRLEWLWGSRLCSRWQHSWPHPPAARWKSALLCLPSTFLDEKQLTAY